MAKDIVVQVNKCVLVISENELMKCLARETDIFKRAISRGKAFKRTQNVGNRMKGAETVAETFSQA